MQFRILSAFIIFLGSYLPLALILAVQDIDISWWQQDICGFDSIANCVFDPFSNPHLANDNNELKFQNPHSANDNNEFTFINSCAYIYYNGKP